MTEEAVTASVAVPAEVLLLTVVANVAVPTVSPFTNPVVVNAVLAMVRAASPYVVAWAAAVMINPFWLTTWSFATYSIA